jgi:D-xylose transport system permease protein
VRRWWDIVRSGEIGSTPIVVAIVLIAIFFYSKNSNAGATNFNNLIVQMAGTATNTLGVVFVLLIGEIDLSVGYVSGLGG